jgi:phospholipase/carboxylesterase
LSALEFIERPAAGPAAGLLVLHHGRGTSEQDLMPLADVLDPQRQLHVVAPRAPLEVPGAPGFHWYLVPRVGHPDPRSFAAARATLGEFHDELWERTGLAPGQTILGGFSMGSVMSYALALGAERPAPAGILALSGFLPPDEEWQPEFSARREVRVFITHGTLDPVIEVAHGRDAAERLRAAGLDVEYRESAVGHEIDPSNLPPARDWLGRTLAAHLPADP